MRVFSAICIYLILAGAAFAGRTQPLPEFASGYQLPSTNQPPPAAAFYQYIDAALLAAAILLAAYLALRKRSRRYMLALTIAAVVYFGFIRQGCICPIGGIQNFTLTFADATYVLPIAAAAVFLMPLIAALFFGRVFCAAVCPLGAIQELALVRPVTVPRWLEQGLAMLRYLYLALAILFIVTSGTFLICMFDPFVGLFRFSASLPMLIFGLGMLGISMFIGRPYCRFLCPYAVLLKFLATVAKWHVSITPDQCINCRLCENACPYGAIRKPTSEPASRSSGKRQLVTMLALLPLLICLGGFAGRLAAAGLAGNDPTISRAAAVWQFEQTNESEMPDLVKGFYRTEQRSQVLFAEAEQVRRRWNAGGWLIGIFIGLVIGSKLIALSVRRTRNGYEADRGDCLSCGRCFAACPKEQLRLQGLAK